MESTLSFDNNISNVTRSMHYYLHSLRIVIFDYCNFTFHLTHDFYLSRLYTLQNSIVRCIYQINKFSHTNITQYLIKLHWLPIKSRCIYNLARLAHKARYHHSSDYLSSLITTNPIKLEQSTP